MFVIVESQADAEQIPPRHQMSSKHMITLDQACRPLGWEHALKIEESEIWSNRNQPMTVTGHEAILNVQKRSASLRKQCGKSTKAVNLEIWTPHNGRSPGTDSVDCDSRTSHSLLQQEWSATAATFPFGDIESAGE